MKNRIDKQLVIMNLAPSRTKAKELIENNLVVVNGTTINKCNIVIDENDNINILENDKLKYVSRGGLKLEKAINEFNIDMNNLVVMDIGSSTGGFTDCCLKHGTKRIIAVDVGTDVMVETLKSDARVELYENTDFRKLDSKYFQNIDFFVCDVSFISLKLIIKKLLEENVIIDGVFLIKPQFECGKDIAKKYKGVILDESIHENILSDMISYFTSNRVYVKGLTVSPVKGGDGNIEYLVYLSTKVNENVIINIEEIVKYAFSKK